MTDSVIPQDQLGLRRGSSFGCLGVAGKKKCEACKASRPQQSHKTIIRYLEAVASGVITQLPKSIFGRETDSCRKEAASWAEIGIIFVSECSGTGYIGIEIPMRRRLPRQLVLGMLCSLFLATIGETVSLPVRQNLFPSNCIAILVVGLPGDLESEKTYDQQLQGWLEIVANGGTVQKLF